MYNYIQCFKVSPSKAEKILVQVFLEVLDGITISESVDLVWPSYRMPRMLTDLIWILES